MPRGSARNLRFNTMFPAKLSEIAILVTARHFTAHYEWWAHKRLALKGGMDPEDHRRHPRPPHARVRRSQGQDDLRGRESRCMRATASRRTLYDEAVAVLTERGLVEVIGLCGYYTLVSLTLNTFEFGLPEGEVSELM